MTQEENPYRPPESNVSDSGTSYPINLAGKGRRLGTLLIDYVGIALVGFGVGLIAVLFFGEEGLQAIERTPDIVLGLPIVTLYYIFFEGVWGRTPGKFVFGTIVVNEQGGKPTIGQITGRTFCRLIPFEPFSFFGERGWHDSIPKTRVVLVK
jgi:uncharacterized RDD family membrane protein YckC